MGARAAPLGVIGSRPPEAGGSRSDPCPSHCGSRRTVLPHPIPMGRPPRAELDWSLPPRLKSQAPTMSFLTLRPRQLTAPRLRHAASTNPFCQTFGDGVLLRHGHDPRVHVAPSSIAVISPRPTAPCHTAPRHRSQRYTKDGALTHTAPPRLLVPPPPSRSPPAPASRPRPLDAASHTALSTHTRGCYGGSCRSLRVIRYSYGGWPRRR